MMKSAHTPGPWDIDKFRFVGQGEVTICEVWSHMGLEEAGANGRLIAAAPELLEALQLIIQWREVIAKSEIPAKSAILEDFDDAQSAIAKATGSAA